MEAIGREKKVLLFGRPGSGKSTLANMLVSGGLLADPIFTTGDGMLGVTEECEGRSGRGFDVIDTVGLGDQAREQRSHQAFQRVIYDFLKRTRGDYSYILFVTSAGRSDQLDEVVFQTFKAIFSGAESAFGVIVTKCENPSRWREANEIILREKYGKLNDRYEYVNFPPLNDDPEWEDLLAPRRSASLERLENSLNRFFEVDGFRYHRPDYANIATDEGLRARAGQIFQAIWDLVLRILQGFAGRPGESPGEAQEMFFEILMAFRCTVVERTVATVGRRF